MENYKHIIQFYETDKMGITHHSNYIRFMEEARGFLMDKIGWNYKIMEDNGICSVVISVESEFKKPTTYADEIEIKTYVENLSSAKVSIGYVMTCLGQVVCTGKSSHCFLDRGGRPMAIKKISRDFYDALQKLFLVHKAELER